MPLDLQKEHAGQPGYVWLAGGLAAVGALVYILYKSRQAGGAADTSSGGTGAAGPTITGLSTGQLQGWLANHQGSTVTTHKTTCPKGFHWSAKQRKCVKNPKPRLKTSTQHKPA